MTYEIKPKFKCREIFDVPELQTIEDFYTKGPASLTTSQLNWFIQNGYIAPRTNEMLLFGETFNVLYSAK